MERFKIALVCDWYLPRIGGIEIHLHDLARELINRGHEVHIITTTRRPHASDQHIKVHRLNCRLIPGWDVICNPFSVANTLENIFRQEKYNIVHAHSFYSLLAVTAVNRASRLGVASVYSNHSLLAEPPKRMFKKLFKGTMCLFYLMV